MPMHDWTRVDAGIYHDFHGVWLYAVRHALNNGVLPAGYYALTDQVVRPLGPDVLTLQPRSPVGPPAGGVGLTALAEHPPRVQTVVSARPTRRPRAQRRLTVRHVSDHRIVAVVELVSPGNKSNRRDFTAFVEKAVTLLEAGIHLLVIDPFPPTRRDPASVHGAVWRRLVRGKYTPPADRPLTAASYAAGAAVTACVEPFTVGDPVPPMPLFLEPDAYVTVPLEETYRAAWPEVPDYWRQILAG